MRSYDNLKAASLRINKNIYSEAITSMYHDECDKIISEKEFNQYVIDYNPTLTCKFYFDKENDWWKYVAFIQYNDGNNIRTMNNTTAIILQHPREKYYGKMFLGNVNCVLANDLFFCMTEDNKAKPYEYDLISMYYIYANRQSCMNINPNYAKEKVLAYYDEVWGACDNEDQLVFLRANAKIMGICVKGFSAVYESEFRYGIVDEEVDRKVTEEVELLYNLILKRLNNL